MLLECEQITMLFGGLAAVNRVDLAVRQGEIFGLIGPNGSGKTTVFNMVSGVYRPTAGRIIFDGRDIAGRRPDYVTRCGIARTFQNIRLFQDMTVWENVLVGGHCRFSETILDDMINSRRKRQQEEAARERLRNLLEMFKISHLAKEQAKNLPYGLQRELEIVRALAAEPKLLLLDEPAAGMNPQETAQLMRFIQGIRDLGITILVVEHDMKLVMSICDRVAVLNYGRKIAEGSPREIQANPEVISAYLGKQVKHDA